MGLPQPISFLGAALPFSSFSFRSDNFSQDGRNLFLVRRNIATQKFAQGYGPYVCRLHGEAQGLCIPSMLQWHNTWFGHHSCGFAQHMASKSHTRGSPTGSETDTDDPYIFMEHTKTPLSAIQIPKTSIMDKNQSTVVAEVPRNNAMVTPYHPHKPSHVETPPQRYPSQDCVVRKKGITVPFSVTMPWYRDFSAMDSSHHHQAFFPEICKHSLGDPESAGPSTESRSLGDCFHQSLGKATPDPCGTSSPAPEKSPDNVKYVALDFQ
ncbi:GRB2-associated-binding protein 2 [Sciurus carolinensis]|uniref:GRB2-associated-binding protein 2 n=1 Tax=Sciurus carolinensis TaxID=30640 RepID=A0AA41MLV6_SCICA|nr:GRB2-associated-binding protein 2 [Sciurus carolinensis]